MSVEGPQFHDEEFDPVRSIGQDSMSPEEYEDLLEDKESDVDHEEMTDLRDDILSMVADYRYNPDPELKTKIINAYTDGIKQFPGSLDPYAVSLESELTLDPRLDPQKHVLDENEENIKLLHEILAEKEV